MWGSQLFFELQAMLTYFYCLLLSFGATRSCTVDGESVYTLLVLHNHWLVLSSSRTTYSCIYHIRSIKLMKDLTKSSTTELQSNKISREQNRPLRLRPAMKSVRPSASASSASAETSTSQTSSSSHLMARSTVSYSSRPSAGSTHRTLWPLGRILTILPDVQSSDLYLLTTLIRDL
ncbi:hypothetical protein BDP27DRAFT_805306 [Rhodocollybia butyracea]|uniref:Uncharacterized protein n=1 Tax=Rhodocollybia butyracea TaxID=206335 RepID=A0A9P5Q1I6_9AGAR|nr:hypothetical protein BDP27DRAFT_805306 [Rhodocollybia butyracea]